MITATLWPGSAPAITSSVPASAGTAWAVAWLSPVSSTVRSPSRRSPATAAAADGLTVSATATAPRTWPSHPASTVVQPACSHAAALLGHRCRDGHPQLAEQALAADDHLMAVHRPACPQAGQGREPGRLRQRRPVPRAPPALMAAATGCSDACSTAPA